MKRHESRCIDINIMLHSLPRLTAPIPPTGFSVRFKFNPKIPLHPVVVYQCTIELINFVANLPWAFTIQNSITMSGEDAPTEVSVDRWPPTGESNLQAQHVVLGLYQTGVAIAQGNNFIQLDAFICMKGSEIGWLAFRPERAPQHEGSEAVHATHLNAHNMYNGTSIRIADSGRLLDPEDKNFVITFHWDGVRIKSQDIFTAILDGFTIAAEHDNKDLDAYIPAARSSSGDTVLSTWTVGEKQNQHMTWRLLKRTLFLVWDSLILGYEAKKMRFEGVAFELEYEGQKIGAGRMLKFDNHDQNVEGIGVEK